MGDYLLGRLNELKDKHEIIGDVRGKGLFCGVELVEDRETRKAVHESVAQAVVADCLAHGVLIGMTNRSLHGLNNTLCLSPAYICTKADIDEIVDAIDGALGRVAG